MVLTEDEQDAIAATCGLCWARPGACCHTPKGVLRRPHELRLKRARRRGLLGGGGRAYLEQRPGYVIIETCPPVS